MAYEEIVSVGAYAGKDKVPVADGDGGYVWKTPPNGEIDEKPTQGSDKAVSSGGVYDAITEIDKALDGKENIGAAEAVQENLDTHAANEVLHVTAAKQAAWNAKQDAISGAASTIASSNLTANRVLVADSSGKVSVSDITSTELEYLDGAAGNVQNQINGKEASGTAASAVSAHNTNSSAHSDIREAIPKKTSELTNDSGYITIDDVPEGAVASTTTPKMDGTAVVGTEKAFARGDHAHPTDTSRQAAITASGILKGTGSSVIAAEAGTDYATPGVCFTLTLSASGWSDSTQTASSSNLLASGYAYTVTPASGSFAAYAEAVIYADNVSTAGKMTFHCTETPTEDLTVNVLRTEVTT